MISYHWKPKESYGTLLLGDDIKKYHNILGLFQDKLDPITGWATYKSPHADISVYVEQEKIIVIEINDNCFYKGVNLIGLSFESLKSLLLCEPDEAGKGVEYEDGDVQYPYQFNNLGLDVWVSETKVVAVSISKF